MFWGGLAKQCAVHKTLLTQRWKLILVDLSTKLLSLLALAIDGQQFGTKPSICIQYLGVVSMYKWGGPQWDFQFGHERSPNFSPLRIQTSTTAQDLSALLALRIQLELPDGGADTSYIPFSQLSFTRADAHTAIRIISHLPHPTLHCPQHSNLQQHLASGMFT